MFSKTITSEKIILRPYGMVDFSSWEKWDLDLEVQVFLPEPKNEPVSIEVYEKYLKECEDEQDGYYWSIVWKEDSKLVGTISITDINKHHGIGELGIVIGEKEYWKRGIAQEAIKIVLDFARNTKLRRISAELEEGNIGMEKALLKSGFNKEGIAPFSRVKDGHPINTIKYFILL